MSSNRRYSKKRQCIETKKYIKNKRTRRLKRGGGTGKKQWSKLSKNIRSTKGYLLKTLCPDSGVCIAFGTYKDYISRYFSNFTDFSILESVKPIGEEVGYSMILQLEYKKAEYTAHTVLKIPINENLDNILYESLVGFFLNKQSLRYPSFLETYGVYKFVNGEVNCFNKLINIYIKLNELDKCLTLINESYNFSTVNVPHEISRIKTITESVVPDKNGNYPFSYHLDRFKLETLSGEISPEKYKETLKEWYDEFKYKLKPQLLKNKNTNLRCILKNKPFKDASEINEEIINDSCKNPTNYAVLIQHLKGAKTLRDMLEDSKFLETDLLYILFQVYMTLSSLSNDFTHYDLHLNNVLVYEPVSNSYIEYHYHIGKTEIIFKSKYIAKIIDYGTCYFSPGFNPESYFECLHTQSLFSFSGEYNKNSAKRNMSYDLDLINKLKFSLNKDFKSLVWISEMPEIVYGKRIQRELGVENEDFWFENEEKGYPAQINNVTDAYLYLKDIVTHQTQLTANENHYNGMKELGKLHIFDDGKNMEYIPFSNRKTQYS